MAKPTHDMSKLMEQFRIPGVDWAELMAAQQKNLDALTRANQTLLQGAEAVMKREMEILQKAMEEATAASQALMSETDPQANATKRFELARTAFETALANMRELAELAGKSHREALDVVNKRTLAAFDEVKTALDKAQKPGPSGRS
jgi:phasin family protein